jgi:hypothetical protein
VTLTTPRARTGLSLPLSIGYVLLIAWLAWHAAANPSWNLDGIFYSALLRQNAASATDVHREIYAAITTEVPTAARQALLSGSEYRQALRDQADVFSLQLPFYTSKPLYVWAGQLARLLGASALYAPYAVSAACFLMIGLYLPRFAIASGSSPTFAFPAAALTMLSPQIRELGALASPDALAALLIVLAASLAYRGVRWMALPLVAAALTRPDCAFLGLGILVACWTSAQSKGHTRDLVGAAVVICVVATLVPYLMHSYTWSTVMRHTFAHRVVAPADIGGTLAWRDYLSALRNGLHGQMTAQSARFLPFLLLAVVGVAAYWKSRFNISRRTAAHVLAACWIATAVRFLAFPLLADRFFAPTYLCSTALVCALLAVEPHASQGTPHATERC